MRMFILFFSLFLFQLTNLSASISINTKYLLFDDKTRNNDVSIINASDAEQTYKVSFIYLKQNSNGSYEANKDPALIDAAKYLKVTPKIFKLKPYESQTIRVQKMSMADSKDGEYNLHMLIQEQPEDKPVNNVEKEESKDLAIKIKALFAVSIPVVVRKGQLTATNTIDSAEFFVEEDTIKLKIKLSRTGNRSSRGDLVLKSNKDILARAEGVNIFLSSNIREFTLSIGSKDDKDLLEKLQKNLVLSYEDSFNPKIILTTLKLNYKQ